jgi:hypothetical protein
MEETHIKKLLTELKPIAGFSKERNESQLGFNVFQLISNTYYQENFHSYILYHLLSPEYHDDGRVFLELFLDCLNKASTLNIDKNEYKNPVVEREQGRIDVRIRDYNSKKTIIIENKINDAIDMYLQIPRYYEAETKAGYTVDAIVYLTLIKSKMVSKMDWSEKHITAIDPKIIYLPAVSSRHPNLCDHWIEKCLLETRNKDVSSTLRQYKNLLNHLSLFQMDMQNLEKLYNALDTKEKYDTAKYISNMLQELNQFRASHILEKFAPLAAEVFQHNSMFKDDKVFRAKFEKSNYIKFDFWIDILCLDNETKIFVVETYKYYEAGNDRVKLLLENISLLEEFEKESESSYYKTFHYPDDEPKLMEFLNYLLNQLANRQQIFS